MLHCCSKDTIFNLNPHLDWLYGSTFEVELQSYFCNSIKFPIPYKYIKICKFLIKCKIISWIMHLKDLFSIISFLLPYEFSNWFFSFCEKWHWTYGDERGWVLYMHIWKYHSKIPLPNYIFLKKNCDVRTKKTDSFKKYN